MAEARQGPPPSPPQMAQQEDSVSTSTKSGQNSGSLTNSGENTSTSGKTVSSNLLTTPGRTVSKSGSKGSDSAALSTGSFVFSDDGSSRLERVGTNTGTTIAKTSSKAGSFENKKLLRMNSGDSSKQKKRMPSGDTNIAFAETIIEETPSQLISERDRRSNEDIIPTDSADGLKESTDTNGTKKKKPSVANSTLPEKLEPCGKSGKKGEKSNTTTESSSGKGSTESNAAKPSLPTDVVLKTNLNFSKSYATENKKRRKKRIPASPGVKQATKDIIEERGGDIEMLNLAGDSGARNREGLGSGTGTSTNFDLEGTGGNTSGDSKQAKVTDDTFSGKIKAKLNKFVISADQWIEKNILNTFLCYPVIGCVWISLFFLLFWCGYSKWRNYRDGI